MAGKGLQSAVAGCEIFSTLGSAEHARLALLFRPKSFNKGETIFLKGDPGLGLYLIRSGRVKISALDREGAELIFTFLRQGDMLGDMAILDGKPRSATAVAVEDTDTVYLERGDFLEFLKTSPQACIEIITLLCQRLRRLSTQMEEMSFLDVSGRIARKLIESTTGTMEGRDRAASASFAMSQEELANVIGASRVMVNKVLNSFVDLGLISIARRRIGVLDAKGLHRLAAYDGEG